MNKYYAILIVIISFSTYADNGINVCVNEILSTSPYGVDAIIDKPRESEITENDKEVIYNWNYSTLRITAKDGSRPYAVGRCVYNKESEKITFLSIYTDTIISAHPDELKSLKDASKGEANNIAKNIGLSDQQINWIKYNGRRSFYGFYNPDGKIVGLQKHDKKDLIHLDRLQIINLYPDHSNGDQYYSVATKISKLLHDRLK